MTVIKYVTETNLRGVSSIDRYQTSLSAAQAPSPLNVSTRMNRTSSRLGI